MSQSPPKNRPWFNVTNWFPSGRRKEVAVRTWQRSAVYFAGFAAFADTMFADTMPKFSSQQFNNVE
jgi:hypothetical protein